MTFFHPRIFPRFRQNRTTGRIFCSGAMVNGHFPLKSLKDNVFRPSFCARFFLVPEREKTFFRQTFPHFCTFLPFVPAPKASFSARKSRQMNRIYIFREPQPAPPQALQAQSSMMSWGLSSEVSTLQQLHPTPLPRCSCFKPKIL